MKQMLYAPILNLAILIEAAFVTVLGLHGVYVRSVVVDFLGGRRDPADLFLTLDMPHWLDRTTEWVSLQAVDSWSTPISLLVAGIVLFYLRNYISKPPTVIRSGSI
jgi:hypothetical protein